MKKTILITGSAGLVGANLIRWMLDNTNDYLIGVDNLSGGYIENMPNESDRFKFYKMNVESDEFFDVFKNHKITHVIHAAAFAAECMSPFMRKYNVVNNILSTSNVINCCINYGIERLIFFSTMATYGNSNGTPPPFDELEEISPKTPIDPYGLAKLYCERDIEIANKQHGLDYCIVLPHNIIGKYQAYNDSYRNVIGIWSRKYMYGEPMLKFGDGNQKRAFSFINDFLPCIYKALSEKSCSKQKINIGGIKEYTINEASEILIEVLKEDGFPFGEPKVEHREGRHEVKNAYSTYQKSVDLLGFEHKTDLKDGIREMWKWIKEDHLKNKRPILSFDKFEVASGIYSYWKK